MAEADAKDRDFARQKFADGGNGAGHRLRVAGAVGEEDAVRRKRKRFFGAGRCWHEGDAAAASDEQAQDVRLDAVVVGDDVEYDVTGAVRLFRVAVAGGVPDAFRPRLRALDADAARQVLPAHRGMGAGGGDGGDFVNLARHQAGVLCAVRAQPAGDFAGIDVGDTDDAVRA